MTKTLRNLQQREDGFTLVELLVVVLIVGILAAIAIPVYLGIQSGAHKSAVRSDVNIRVKTIQASLTEGATLSQFLGTTTGTETGESIQVKASTTTGAAANDFMVVGSESTTGSPAAAIDYTYTYDSVTGNFTEGGAVALGGGNAGGSAATTPTAAFTATTSGLTVTLDPSATTNASGTGAYYWDTGDGNASRPATNPYTYTYAAAGTYTITLTARNGIGGPTNSTTRTVTVPVTLLDFESNTENFIRQGSSSTASSSTDYANTGTNSFKCVSTGSNYCYYTRTLPELTPGVNYTITGYVRTNTTNGATIGIFRGTGYAINGIYSSTTGWQQFTLTFTYQSGDVFRLVGATGQNVYLDTIKFNPN